MLHCYPHIWFYFVAIILRQILCKEFLLTKNLGDELLVRYLIQISESFFNVICYYVRLILMFSVLCNTLL